MPRIHLPGEQENPCPLHHPDPCKCNPIDLSPEAMFDRDRVRLREEQQRIDEAARRAAFTGEPLFGRGPAAQAAVYEQVNLGTGMTTTSLERMRDAMRQMFVAPADGFRQNAQGDWVLAPLDRQSAVESMLDAHLPEDTRELHQARAEMNSLKRQARLIQEVAGCLNDVLDLAVPEEADDPRFPIKVINRAINELQTWKRRAQQRRLEKKDKW